MVEQIPSVIAAKSTKLAATTTEKPDEKDNGTSKPTTNSDGKIEIVNTISNTHVPGFSARVSGASKCRICKIK